MNVRHKLSPNQCFWYLKSDLLAGNNQAVLPYPPRPIQFSTFPDQRLIAGADFRFVVSSCIIPNFPYRGPLYRNAIQGFDLLAKAITLSNPPPRFMADNSEASPIPEVDFLLFLGDFIYADVPVYIGDQKEAYRRLYRRNYQSHSFRNIYERIRESLSLNVVIASRSYISFQLSFIHTMIMR